MTAKNSQTTLGQTKLVYSETGQLIEQTLPKSAYNRPTPELPTRPQPPTPKTAEQLSAALTTTQDELTATLEHWEKWQHKDEFGEAKRELKMYLAEHEARVREAREKLNELEAADSPFTKLLKNIAQVEVDASNLAKEVQFSAASVVAETHYEQPLRDLSLETRREIYRRATIMRLQGTASAAFHSFGRLELAQRTVEGAKAAAEKIRTAFATISDVIAKACK